MKNILMMLMCLMTIPFVQAQSKYPLTIWVNPASTWKLTLDTITAREFVKTNVVWQPERKTNSDSLLNVFTKQYPQLITKTDSCHSLHARDTVLQWCRRKPADEHGWTGYKAIGVEQGFLLLANWGYESWDYSGFNPQTRQYFLLPDEPRFIGKEFVYSVGNYYGEGEFRIWNLKTNKSFAFGLYNGGLTASYREGHSVFFEVTSNNEKTYYRLCYQ